jgi:hypothetical protein
VVVAGGNSELPGLVPHLRVMLKKKGIIKRNEQVIRLIGQT